MKKTLLLISMLISIGAKAQSLVDTNKIWNVVECVGSGCGTIVLHFEGDTTIGLHQYKLLIIDTDSGGGSMIYPIAAREDTTTKQVFYYYGINDCLAYDFSLNQGDTFTTNLNGCGFQMTVDSVDTVMLLNGDLRKRMFLSNFETWIEGVGSLYGLANVGVYFCWADVYPFLICLKEDSTLKYMNPSYTDCFYITQGISEISSQNNFKVNPNPFNEFTILTFENPSHENCTMKILNTNGQIVKQYSNLTNELKIMRDEMNNGIYFFQVMNDRGMIASGKLVIQ